MLWLTDRPISVLIWRKQTHWSDWYVSGRWYVDMVRCPITSFLSPGSACSLVLVILLGLAVYHQLQTSYELRQELRQEKLKTQKTKEDAEEEIARLLEESREKDNRTQEIYNEKGLCENQLAQCKKQVEKSEATVEQKNLKLETFTTNNKLCSDDLKNLKYVSTWKNRRNIITIYQILILFRDLFDKKKNEAENNFYLFQQKFKDTEFGIKIVDILDIFR